MTTATVTELPTGQAATKQAPAKKAPAKAAKKPAPTVLTGDQKKALRQHLIDVVSGLDFAEVAKTVPALADADPALLKADATAQSRYMLARSQREQ